LFNNNMLGKWDNVARTFGNRCDMGIDHEPEQEYTEIVGGIP